MTDDEVFETYNREMRSYLNLGSHPRFGKRIYQLTVRTFRGLGIPAEEAKEIFKPLLRLADARIAAVPIVHSQEN